MTRSFSRRLVLVALLSALLAAVAPLSFASFWGDFAHECHGADCPVCQRVDMAQALLHLAGGVSALSFIFLAQILASRPAPALFPLRRRCLTLVSLYARLDN